MLQEGCDGAPDTYLPTASEATATLLLALIHDLYHGPFGHSLDRVSDLFDLAGTRIDKGLLLEHVKEAQLEKRGPVWTMVSLVAGWVAKDDPSSWRLSLRNASKKKLTAAAYEEQICDFLFRLVSRKEDILQADPYRYWLRELVDGPLDADRLDYLPRDVHALHWRTALKDDDVGRLISGLSVIQAEIAQLKFDATTEKSSEVLVQATRISWDPSAREVVETLMTTRADLYRDVYESPKKRSFDEMLSHALVWIVRNASMSSDEELARRTVSDLLKKVVAITDAELFHFVYEVATPGRDIIALSIFHDLAVGRPFLPVWKLEISSVALEAAVERCTEIAYAWDDAERDLIRQQRLAGRTLMLGDAANLLKRNVAAVDFESPEDLAALGYLMANIFGQSFQGRELLERRLWKELVEGGGDVDAAQEVEKELVALFSDLTPTEASQKSSYLRFRESLFATPLVFISIPWVPPIAGGNPEDANWELQDRVLFNDNEPTSLEITRKARQRYYPILVYLPPRLAKNEKVRACTIRLMNSLFASLTWSRKDTSKLPWVNASAPLGWVRELGLEP